MLNASTHAAAQYTIFFNAEGGSFSSSVQSQTATLGCALPDCIPSPTRDGFQFAGWATETSDGTLIYAANGSKIPEIYDRTENTELHALWTAAIIVEDIEIPVAWFEKEATAIVATHDGDYESAANETAANGVNKVWECYVAGISPTNAAARFEARIEFNATGKPVVTWTPDLNEGGTKHERVYRVLGAKSLGDAEPWDDVTGLADPDAAGYRFFKAKVALPE